MSDEKLSLNSEAQDQNQKLASSSTPSSASPPKGEATDQLKDADLQFESEPLGLTHAPAEAQSSLIPSRVQSAPESPEGGTSPRSVEVAQALKVAKEAGKMAAPSRIQLIKASLKRWVAPGTLIRDLPWMFVIFLSRDPDSRRGSLLFIFSFLGILSVCSTFLKSEWKIYKAERTIAAQEEAKRVEEAAQKESESSTYKAKVLVIGVFNIELMPDKTNRVQEGIVNLAEVEITVLCDEVSTKEFIEENVLQARGQIAQHLVAMEREELLSRDGKSNLRALLLRKLNAWLPSGKVTELYFSSLILS